MARNRFGQYRRKTDERPMVGEFRQDVPAAGPSETFRLILALGAKVKAGEITPAEYERLVEEAKVAQQKAVMAGRF